MLLRFSIGPSLQTIAGAAAIAVAVTFIGIGAAVADNPKWKITLKSNSSDVKVDVYDAVAGKYIAKDKDASNGLTVEAEAKVGGGSEGDKMGAHIRYEQKHNGRCWWGQVCPTRSGVQQSMGPRPMDDSLGAGNCKIHDTSKVCPH
jgi:hypothetical protein